MPVANQVAVIYAVTNGYLDQVDVEHVRIWERRFHEHLSHMYREILDGITEVGELTEDLEAKLVTAIEEYNEAFGAEQGGQAQATAGASA
jgi:F-type H+-transporting ATPase subunit alpha